MQLLIRLTLAICLAFAPACTVWARPALSSCNAQPVITAKVTVDRDGGARPRSLQSVNKDISLLWRASLADGCGRKVLSFVAGEAQLDDGSRLLISSEGKVRAAPGAPRPRALPESLKLPSKYRQATIVEVHDVSSFVARSSSYSSHLALLRLNGASHVVLVKIDGANAVRDLSSLIVSSNPITSIRFLPNPDSSGGILGTVEKANGTYVLSQYGLQMRTGSS